MRIKEIETHHPDVISPHAGIMEAAQRMKILDVGIAVRAKAERLAGKVLESVAGSARVAIQAR